jgi:ADP-ribose pyrophosphatase YjhB (NUDIX family)
VDEPRLRPAVRAVLVDTDLRVLLVRFDVLAVPVWATPGGGVEPGESPGQALRRELLEEVGLVLRPDAQPLWVWHRPVVEEPVPAGWDGQTDDFYLVRTDAFDPRGTFSDQQLLAEGVGAVRWWTTAELAAARDTVFSPRALPRLVVELLGNGPPDSPTLLGL